MTMYYLTQLTVSMVSSISSGLLEWWIVHHRTNYGISSKGVEMSFSLVHPITNNQHRWINTVQLLLDVPQRDSLWPGKCVPPRTKWGIWRDLRERVWCLATGALFKSNVNATYSHTWEIGRMYIVLVDSPAMQRALINGTPVAVRLQCNLPWRICSMYICVYIRRWPWAPGVCGKWQSRGKSDTVTLYPRQPINHSSAHWALLPVRGERTLVGTTPRFNKYPKNTRMNATQKTNHCCISNWDTYKNTGHLSILLLLGAFYPLK